MQSGHPGRAGSPLQNKTIVRWVSGSREIAIAPCALCGLLGVAMSIDIYRRETWVAQVRRIFPGHRAIAVTTHCRYNFKTGIRKFGKYQMCGISPITCEIWDSWKSGNFGRVVFPL